MRNHIVRSPETDRYILKVPERSSELIGQPVLSVAKLSSFDSRFDPSDYSPGVVRIILGGTVDRAYVSGGSFANGIFTVQQAGLYFINLRLVFASTVTGSWVMNVDCGYNGIAPTGWPASLADAYADGRTGLFQIAWTLSGVLRLPAGVQVKATITPLAMTGTGGVYVQMISQLDIFQVGP